MKTGRSWSTGIICDAVGMAGVASPLQNEGAGVSAVKKRHASIKKSSTESVGTANPSICKLVS